MVNVVSATLYTNALSTSDTMEDQVDFLVAVEAALLFVPIAIVLAWQVYVNRKALAPVLALLSGPLGERSAPADHSNALEEPLHLKTPLIEEDDEEEGLAEDQEFERALRAKSASTKARPGAEDVSSDADDAALGSSGGGARS